MENEEAKIEFVLDKGYICLLDSMPHWNQPDSKTGLKAADARVVQAARVSMNHLSPELCRDLGLEVDEEERTYEQDVKLINYLLKNNHTSPFEKVKFEFVQKLPIFIARQQVRHRMANINEVSARYSKLPCDFYVPELSRMQRQSTSNKQASGDVLETMGAHACHNLIRTNAECAYGDYEELLKRGLARELARMVLPTNFYTHWFWTNDLSNLMKFLKLRLHIHSQYEIRVYAEAMLKMIEMIAPISIAAFREHILEK